MSYGFNGLFWLIQGFFFFFISIFSLILSFKQIIKN